MFHEFFSDPKFREEKFACWFGDFPFPSEIEDAVRELKLPPGSGQKEIIETLMSGYGDPKIWKRVSKEKVKHIEFPYDFEFMESVEAFEEHQEHARVLDKDLFNKHKMSAGLGLGLCWMRSFIFEGWKKFGHELGDGDIEMVVITDPKDEQVIGWFMHED